MCWKKLSDLHSHIEHTQIEMALECIQKKLDRIEAILKRHAHEEERFFGNYHHQHHDEDESFQSGKSPSCKCNK